MRIFFSAKLILVCIFCAFAPKIYAGYMLPYPSNMPGSKLYFMQRFVDSVKSYWYFGDIAQAKYHLLLSDKYLVESKTLMEYKQYLLAKDALIRSDKHFEKLKEDIIRVQKNQKDSKEIGEIITNAASSHIEMLNRMQTFTPESAVWTPERGDATQILIHELISDSKLLRLGIKSFIKSERL